MHNGRWMIFTSVSSEVPLNTHLQRTNAATDSGIGASRRRGAVAFAAEVQTR